MAILNQNPSILKFEGISNSYILLSSLEAVASCPLRESNCKTSSFPMGNGRFTPLQKAIKRLVLRDLCTFFHQEFWSYSPFN